MGSVGIFEPSWHPELIPPMVRIISEAKNDLTVYTTQDNRDHMYNDLDDGHENISNCVVKKGRQSWDDFFNLIELDSKDLDLLWVITAYGSATIREQFLNFSPCCKSVVFLHASSRYVPPKGDYISDFFSQTMANIGPYIPEPVYDKIWKLLIDHLSFNMIDSFDAWIGLYPTVADYVQNNSATDQYIDWFLPSIYTPYEKGTNSELQITIPGRVTNKLRDYEMVFKIIDNLRLSNTNIDVCILGRPVDSSGREIMSKCEAMSKNGLNITYFPDSSWINARTFNNELRQTDLIIAPDRISGQASGSNNSIRGKTKTTGLVGDAVSIGKPVLMPEEFPVANQFKGLIYSYADPDEAESFVRRWKESKEFRDSIEQKAENAAENFCLEKQADSFQNISDSINSNTSLN